MDELDRTEEMPRDDHALSPLSLTRTRAARGTRERLALPPPLPSRAKRWTATSMTASPPQVAKEISPSGGFTLHPAGLSVARTPTMPPIPAAARRPAPSTASGVLTSPPADDETAPLRRSRPIAVPVAPAPRASRPLDAVVPEDKPVAPTPAPSLTEELQLLTAAEVEPGEPTAYYDRPEDAPSPSRRWLVIGGALVVVTTIAIIGVVAVARSSSAAVASAAPTPSPAATSTPSRAVVATVVPAPAPPAPPAPASASAPPATATPAPAPAPRTLELAVTTIPAGASVTLIDDGAATVIGKTPVKAALAKARGYDLVFALPGHQTAVYHLAPDERAPLTIDLRSVATPKPRRR